MLAELTFDCGGPSTSLNEEAAMSWGLPRCTSYDVKACLDQNHHHIRHMHADDVVTTSK